MPFRIEGERNVAVKVISAQILICLTIMRSSISLEENDSESPAWDAVSRLSSDDVLYILLAAPLACCSSCQFLFGCQCLFRFESMPACQMQLNGGYGSLTVSGTE